MAVKLVLMESGDLVIADVKQAVEGDKVIFTVLDHPFFAELVEVEQEPELLMEEDLVDMDEDDEDDSPRYNVAFTEWQPLTSDRKISIEPGFVVSIMEPKKEVKESYEDRIEKLYGINGK
tara:strand:+ start:1791 stop:2150 length:360 start_codon:yes stop_codon:yes gene_type:complete